QQCEDFLAVPAGVPELDRDPNPAGYQPQEIVQPGVVTRVRRRELDKQHRSLAVESVPACADALDPGLGCQQLPRVGEPPGRLDREPEPTGQPPAPGGELSRARPAVEAAVELCGREGGDVPRQP